MGQGWSSNSGGSDGDASSNSKSIRKNPPAMKGIKYQPLNCLKAEIRVVTILPRECGNSSVPIVNPGGYVQPDIVHCQINHVSLKGPRTLSPLSQLNWTNNCETSVKANPPSWRYEWGDYVALSYTWGSPDHTRTIIVNGQEVIVRSNLEAALRVLREKGPIRMGYAIWIDALCINQDDIPERNEEVRRMRTIYKQARDIVVWLGEDANESAQAMGLLRVLAKSVTDGTDRDLGNSLREAPDLLGHGSWRALSQLMERPYWDRLWIMQEIAMGGEHTPILCGNGTVSWAELYHGTYTFGNHNVDLMFTLINQECSDAGIPPFGLNRNRIIHLWDEQNVQAGRKQQQIMCMLDLGRKSLTTEPRDKIYGVMGMMSAAVVEKIKPNYNISLADLYTSFAEVMISTSQSLEILEQCTWHSSSMPSWVPDWNDSNHYRLFSGRSTYHATLDRKWSFQIDSKAGLLSCRALVIGEIDGLGASYYQSYRSSDPEDALIQPENVNNPYESDASLCDALWRALTGSRTPGGKPAPNHYRSLLRCSFVSEAVKENSPPAVGRGKAAFNLLLEQNSTFRIAGRELASYFPTSGGPDLEDACDALERVFRFLRSRRLILTLKGHIGLGPHAARRGDIVVLLLGCNVPMLVRPVIGQPQYYKVVGGCYLQGFMEGEAMRELDRQALQPEMIVLC